MTPASLRRACAVLMLSALLGCHEPGDYTLIGPNATGTPSNGTAIDDVLAVSAFPDKLQADGFSRTTVTAHIVDAKSTVRDITFSTNLGTLYSGTRSSATEGGKLTLTADVRGVATVELKGEAVIGTAKVTVTVGSVVRVLDVPFVPVTADAVLVLQTSSPTVAADGFSLVAVTATLTIGGDPRQPVKFTTNMGTLVTSANDSGTRTETTVTADAQGIARIFLRSEQTVGTASIRADVGGFSREVQVEFQPVTPADVIRLVSDRTQVPADGVTGARVIATVSASVPQRLRTVTFTTTAGEFATDLVDNNKQRASVTADAGNVAMVEVRSAATGTATITATIANVSARVVVEFTRALPDAIFVEASSGSVLAVGAGSVTITATLSRDVGQVANQPVVFTAVDSAGRTIGTFSEVTQAVKDANGDVKATAKFNPDDTATLGAATITAAVGSVKGTVALQLE